MKNQTTIEEIKVGEQFICNGHKYTKLQHLYNSSLCILDDFDEDIQYCPFDNLNNNYKESLIRHYINTRLYKLLGIKKADLEPTTTGDKLMLLSKEEYNEFKHLIKDFDEWWWLRSAGSSASNACLVYSHGSLSRSNVTNGDNGVRPALQFKNLTKCSRED